ncbi:MAG: transposase, partial [Proteobacteria bacterium]|nr:transposase [Pseudomonadota bacterium]
WNLPIEPSPEEVEILKLVKRHRRLFGFLRMHRHELFNDEFQAELETMYRDTGAGDTPKPLALMCMVLFVQAYVKASDVEAVVASRADARWKLVLGSLGSDEPLFSQGCLQQFRQRLIEHGMDRRLLKRTIELAREIGGFDWRKLPKTLQVGIDSRPLVGAGRVEDTFNLLGHAARKVLRCASKLTGLSPQNICSEAGCRLFLASSVKAGLDIDWSDKEQKSDALNRLMDQVVTLTAWVEQNIEKRRRFNEPIQHYLDALDEFEGQDLERDSDGTFKIRNEVAKDRRISVQDPEESGSATERTPSQLGGPLSADKVLPLSTTADVRPPASATMDKSKSREPGPVEQSEGEGDEDEIADVEPAERIRARRGRRPGPAEPVIADVEPAEQYKLTLRIEPADLDVLVRIDGLVRKGRAFVLDAGIYHITVSAAGVPDSYRAGQAESQPHGADRTREPRERW